MGKRFTGFIAVICFSFVLFSQVLVAAAAPVNESSFVAQGTGTVADEVVPVDWDSLNTNLTQDALTEDLIKVINNANKYMVNTWWNAKGYAAQGGEYLTFGGNKLANIRPPAHLSILLAGSLKLGIYDADYTGVSDAEALAIAKKLTASLAAAHVANKTGGWGGPSGAMGTDYWAADAGYAGWLLWDDLSATDRTYVARMMENEANAFMVKPVRYYKDKTGKIVYPGDTKAEENAWDTTAILLACAMMPNHENRDQWMSKGLELAISSYSAPSDNNIPRTVNGIRVDKMLRGSNMLEDGTVINHSRVHPDYMSCIVLQSFPATAFAFAGQPTPEALFFNYDKVFEAFTELEFSTADGHAEPGGTIYYEQGGVKSPLVYYPAGIDAGALAIGSFIGMDMAAYVFGLDNRSSSAAEDWLEPKLGKLFEMQSRFNTGQCYAGLDEYNFVAAEEEVAQHLIYAYITLWAGENDMYNRSNAAMVDTSGLALTSVALEAPVVLKLGDGGTANVVLNDYHLYDSNTVIAYTSSNPAVATIDADGNITALAAGTTQIGVSATRSGTTLTDSTKLNVSAIRTFDTVQAYDFNEGTGLPTGFTPTNGATWEIKNESGNGILAQTKASNAAGEQEQSLVIDFSSSQDMAFEAKLRYDTSVNIGYGGIMIGYTDQSNRGIVNFRLNNNMLYATSWIGGTETNEVAFNVPLPQSEWHALYVQRINGVLEIYVDGVLVGGADAESYGASGKVGLYTYRAGFSFDDVKIYTDSSTDHTAAEVAQSITRIAPPARDALSLTLPTLPDGFTAEIVSVTPQGVVALDGTITPPLAATTVSIVLNIKKSWDSSSAQTQAINVVIPATALQKRAFQNTVTYDFTGLTEVPQGMTISGGTWVILNEGGNDFIKQTTSNLTTDLFAIFDGNFAGDIAFETKIRREGTTSTYPGLAIGIQGGNRTVADWNKGKFRIMDYENNVNDPTFPAFTVDFPANEWHDLYVQRIGTRVQLFFDGVYIGEKADTKYTSGAVGLALYKTVCSYDDVKIHTNRVMTLEDVEVISMVAQPAKTAYYVGEDIDVSGAKIKVDYSNGASAEVDVTADMISGYDKNTAGTQTITVTHGDKTVTFDVTVEAQVIAVTGVALDKSAQSIPVGGTTTLAATVTPPDATNKAVTWSSSNEGVAAVSQGGVVTGIAAGTATVTATTADGNKTASCAVTVTEEGTEPTPKPTPSTDPAIIPADSISISKAAVLLKVKKAVTLNAAVSPADATDKTVTWTSSAPKIAKVDKSTGKVTALKTGKAVITAKTANGKTAKCTVYVNGTAVKKVTLNKAKADLRTGKTLRLKAIINPTSASHKIVIWKSSDTSIATVTSKGVVKGLKKGKVKITATSEEGGKKATCMVTVK